MKLFEVKALKVILIYHKLTLNNFNNKNITFKITNR